MRCVVKIQDDADFILAAINPDNHPFPHGDLKDAIENETYVVEIDGSMSIGQIKYTVDDLLTSAILAWNVKTSLGD